MRLSARNSLSLSLLTFSLAFSFGCNGNLEGDGGGGAGGDSSRALVVGEDDVPSLSTRYRRLTHAEWDKTVQDLLKLGGSSGHSDSFRADPIQGGYIFDGNGSALEVDQALWAGYQRAALELAEAIASNDEYLTDILPEDADSMSDSARARAFIEEFGEKAHRRPLTDEQIDGYLELYETGTSAYDSHPGFEGGMRLLLEGFLQSPHFLYRVESSTEESNGIIPLDGYERASRMSYFLWGTMPDQKLFDAAKDGDLDSTAGVREQARRMVKDARARDIFVNFFEKVLDVERYEQIAPSPDQFPGLTDTLKESAKEETRHFIEGVLYEDVGSLRDVFVSNVTYVNAELAEIYGLEGSYGSEFERVELDPDQRGGVFTQVGFLAAHSTSQNPDPIHRGVFLARQISCTDLPAPPDDIPPIPAPINASNRDTIDELTSEKECSGCHNIINPFGFPFEQYDAVGAYRTMDGSFEVNAQAEVPLAGGSAEVDGGVDFSRELASRQQVHACLSEHLVEFAQGRSSDDADEVLIDQLAMNSLDDAAFRDLLVEISVAVSFLNRAPDETPDSDTESSQEEK